MALIPEKHRKKMILAWQNEELVQLTQKAQINTRKEA
jgi:hypothetical protein